jgi:outer membrane protein OmpA-like peptidoglycan-associated protein
VPVSRAEAQAGNDAVPVLGATPIAPLRSAKDPSATFLVHGVRRIPSGTVVYYSVGAAGGGSFSSYPLFSFTPSRARGGSDTWGPLFVVDPVHRKGYEGLVTGEKGTWIASDRRSIDSSSMKAGHQYVGYEVFPALPPDVTTVDLVVGHGEVLSGLPVQDGALSPIGGSATQPLELGSGWPQIDLNAVASSYQPQLSVHDLQTTVSTLDKSLTTTRKPGNVRVDLSADVLFAIDKADLTPAAQSRLRAAADTINAQAKQGVITIVGHTDNTGTGTHNDALSLARARAVAHALKPMITVQGVTFDVSGRGEREPVATNGTVEGRRQNRRVSIGFTPRTD